MAWLWQWVLVLVGGAALGFVGVLPAQADGIDDFNASWAGRALAAQRLLDRGESIAESNIIGTHNSFNSAAYATLIRYLDPNQIDTIYNQLRFGVRSIELDVHWTTKTEGAFSYPDRLLLCHGTAAHLGCSLDDRYLTEGLDEIAAWLYSSASEGQVLLLHIEDHMEGQHGEAFHQINDRFGSLVYTSGGCRDLPTELTKADVLGAGKKVLVWNEGGCSGDANWNGMVFTGLGGLGRVWEDTTTIGGIVGSGESIDAGQVAEYFAGGTNIVDLDQLHQNDPRLGAAIWSWDVDEPNDLGGQEDCAVQIASGRWNDDDCNEQRAFACRDVESGSWAVSAEVGPWGVGALACEAMGSTYRFRVPTNSRDNRALKLAREAVGSNAVWLNHNDRRNEGTWLVDGDDGVFYAAGTLTLSAGEFVRGKTRLLRVEPNCNLVLYSVDDDVVGGGLWASGTVSAGADCRLDFQGDGNLVLYDGAGQALWHSSTSGAELHLQDDGNAVIYDGAGSALWQTHTNHPGAYALLAGQFTLSTGQILHTRNRRLMLQSDCDLVLHSFENGMRGGLLWHSGTAGVEGGCVADLQADGNFVIYDSGGQARWGTGTSGTAGAQLRLQEDGNLVLYNGANEPLWTIHSDIASQSVVYAGQFLLSAGEFLQNQTRRLEMQTDGNLVVYSVENAILGGSLWQSGTAGIGAGSYADFQSDGNLVVHDGGGQPHWAAGTSGTSGATLRMQEDGNLVIYNGAGESLWTANSNFPDTSIFDAGQFILSVGQFLRHENRLLEMGADCNLVLYRVSNALPAGAVWHSDTAGAGQGCRADLQADGNLVVYDEGGHAKWASGTSGTAGAQLWLQPDGNLVIYNGAAEPLWTTNTAGNFSGRPVCGDQTCNGEETCSSCPGDCGECAAICGDLACNGGETCSSCPGDCGECAAICGDLACNGEETCSSCPGDCGECPGGCPPIPASCLEPALARLIVKENARDRRDLILWKWIKGEELLQEDLGAPDATTRYFLCLYDSVGGQDSLATRVSVTAGSGWRSKAPRGYIYKDKQGASDGAIKVVLKPGAQARSSAIFLGRGETLPMPAGAGETIFTQDPRVTVQLHNDTTSTCLGSVFHESKKSSTNLFKAYFP